MPFIIGVKTDNMKFFSRSKRLTIYAPISGKTIDLSEVGDEVFRQKMLGDGIAIIPSGDTIVAPVDGKIAFVMESGHAYGIVTKDGFEVLVHIGIDTVKAEGKGFDVLTKTGAIVKKGEPIAKVDRKWLLEQNYDLTAIIIFPNPGPYQLKDMHVGIQSERGETIISTFAT